MEVSLYRQQNIRLVNKLLIEDAPGSVGSHKNVLI
jgi:hypothetical protein